MLWGGLKESVTVILMLYCPETSGLPLITPEADMLSPPGNPVALQVSGPGASVVCRLIE